MSIFAAFMGGILSFFSPCILPLIPVYVTYIFGGKKKNFFNLFLFILGFSIVFILMGATASQLGKIFVSYKVLFRKASGIIILLFGLYMMGAIRPIFLNKEAKLNVSGMKEGYLSSFIFGITFAAGWTPCVGPILATILLYAGTTSTVSVGVILLFAYSLGVGLPFIVAAILIDRFKSFYKKINSIMPYIEKIGGLILIIFGILLYFNLIIRLESYINILG
ncbi:cytochrome c biogenesis CcdA family protein [Thermoanaerobacterium thermosaccharolyticum]|uniref:Cytochrome c biogenesis protein transmembrane region n=1 Tax=Thermoanaerobacterium thermosaccharolyticum (strain ATCC 7956 / DSM 571 / NCIMB 9385 / NCA 3814 / NCTC 13789 / WDCM 00135 / 2032) TaxID=580327 RepID=D9TPV7_THETC|nr:cytochrome c biogenesis protein CcdA [Thermoanaerobacterium thermosaccharolyticum]ADL69126.1 cytochrome c biogenesis protein transmembrane region [Thermoanaerobacterium thermosaccharolyticum DSM 571]MBE0068373.1 cytochrome c biogenesis protein CcdA [Thermoanaerobacterium thermosaccharolyticum]MBE0228348.1 cytochrome c biogenesis protein CcdA [Thermoanaerobacterium thermosaccharolyticum]